LSEMGLGSLFRTPFDKPIPDNHFSNFVRRFSYEVAELSWWERKMASTLFADPPVSTMEEARDHFLAATSTKPSKVLHAFPPVLVGSALGWDATKQGEIR